MCISHSYTASFYTPESPHLGSPITVIDASSSLVALCTIAGQKTLGANIVVTSVNVQNINHLFIYSGVMTSGNTH